MPALLVHLHLYYPDQTGYFIEKLSNICGCKWDLVVTCPEECPEAVESLLSFKPDARIIQVENSGYDVWPFIYVLDNTDIGKYDYVLKLHTKNRSEKERFNGIHFRDYQWRNCLVDSLVGSREVFGRNLAAFGKDRTTGILFGYPVLRKLTRGLPEDLGMLADEMKRLGLEIKDRRFCAGTMFMARIQPYAALCGGAVPPGIFSSVQRSHSIGSMAHVYERILTMVVTSSGLNLRTVPYSISMDVPAFLNRTFSPVIKNIFSLERLGADRRKCLRILGLKFFLE